MGDTIEYSLSPLVHSLIYAECGLNAEYSLCSVSGFAGFKTESKRLLEEFDGFNVTKPFKREIASRLDSVNDNRFDAVNTVYKGVGYNTDYGGFLNHLTSIADLKGLSALVLGAGGVAEIAVYALKNLGLDVFVFNRTLEKAKSLAKKNGAMAALSKMAKYDVVVNCTSVGLNAGENVASGMNFSKTLVAYDTIYFDTEFLKMAAAAGVKHVVNGLGMLIWQAVLANEIFFETTFLDKELLVEKILNQVIKEQSKLC